MLSGPIAKTAMEASAAAEITSIIAKANILVAAIGHRFAGFVAVALDCYYWYHQR